MSAIAKRKGNLPHLASELDFDRGRHVIKHLVIHDDDFQCIPMAKLDREVIPVLLAQNFGHRGIDGSGRHFRGNGLQYRPKGWKIADEVKRRKSTYGVEKSIGARDESGKKKKKKMRRVAAALTTSKQLRGDRGCSDGGWRKGSLG